MTEYLNSIWRCRFFWLSLVRMDLRTRYRRSVLGMGWSLLHPIAMTAILCTMFHKILGVDILEYGPFLLAGLACWNYILSVTLQGCQCLFQGESYIRQYPAPLAIYPLRTTLGCAIHFLLALGVVVVLSWYLHGFGNLPALLTLVPAVLLLFVFGWSLAVLAGFANVYFQDTQHLAEVGFQLLFYATPIIYTEQVLREHSMAWLLQCNPLVAFMQLIREPILQGRPPSPATFAAAVTIVFVAAASAVGMLVRQQRRIIFYL
jgi:ABC-type polysaccharide/polyol phosphate export permease